MSDFHKKYKEKSFWSTFKKINKEILTNPKIRNLVLDALTLYFALSKSNKLTSRQKTSILFALGYFISPLDAVPDAIPVLGWLDDAGVVLAAYKLIKDTVEPIIRKYAKQTFLEKFS